MIEKFRFLVDGEITFLSVEEMGMTIRKGLQILLLMRPSKKRKRLKTD